MALRIIFMGTPDFAVPTLTEIVGQGHEVAAVYSQPPRAAGRGLDLQKSPVHVAAERFGLAVITPRSLKEPDEIDRFAAFGADVGVVVAYGQILPRAVLDAPASGCLNLHASLLPRWRGAAPSPAPSWPATPRPASWSCRWIRASTPAPSPWPSGWRSAPT